MKLRTLKDTVLNGAKVPSGTAVDIADEDLAKRWIEGGYAEALSEKSPKIETASVVKGERAAPKAAQPRKS